MIGDDDEYAFVLDRFEDQDDDSDPRETRCRDCQSTDVYWVETKKHCWTLYDFTTSRKHVCKAEHVTANRLDAFENMD